MWRAFLNLIFPPTCAGCGKEGILLCGTCAVSPRAERTPAPWIHAAFHYHDTGIGRALRAIKYKHNHAVIEDVVTACAETLTHIVDDAQWTLVPIPQSGARARERGFNQASLIARAIVSHYPTCIVREDVLEKIKETTPQARMKHRAERLTNLRSAFRATPEARGMRIILIDDVTTTGATFTEARLTLLSAGASEVLAFAVAH